MSVERAADSASQRGEEEVADAGLHLGRVPEQLDRLVGRKEYDVVIERTCVHGMTGKRIERVVLEDRHDTFGPGHATISLTILNRSETGTWCSTQMPTTTSNDSSANGSFSPSYQLNSAVGTVRVA